MNCTLQYICKKTRNSLVTILKFVKIDRNVEQSLTICHSNGMGKRVTFRLSPRVFIMWRERNSSDVLFGLARIKTIYLINWIKETKTNNRSSNSFYKHIFKENRIFSKENSKPSKNEGKTRGYQVPYYFE